MESKKFLKDVSASTIQVAVTQIANLLIFYLISKYISKEEFGFYNWSMAVVTTIVTIFSLGLDVIYVKRVSTNYKSTLSSKIHFYHTTAIGFILILTIFILKSSLVFSISEKEIFILALVCQVTFSASNSLKLFLNGKERFNYIAYSALVTNTVRVISICILLYLNSFTISNILFCFIGCYLLELGINTYFKKKTLENKSEEQDKFGWNEYFFFIRESVPQLGVIIFDSALARFDWILMGILATSVATAEYSFSFKIFELSKLPYVILAPILLSRFSRLLMSKKELPREKKRNLQNLLNIQVAISLLIPIILVSIWSDFFDWITDGKYGKVNELTFMILAIAIPIHNINNFLWSIGIAQNQLKVIFYNIVIISILNILLNIILIPHYSSHGAAISYAIPSAIQLFFYYKTIDLRNIEITLSTPIYIILFGVILVIVFKIFVISSVVKMIFIPLLFILVLYLFKVINKSKIKSAINAF